MSQDRDTVADRMPRMHEQRRVPAWGVGKGEEGTAGGPEAQELARRRRKGQAGGGIRHWDCRCKVRRPERRALSRLDEKPRGL